jgi:crossover junction endodeoxyribonuclease RuvC
MPDTEADILTNIRGIAHAASIEGLRVTAALEKVHSMPGQGVVSSFKFGMGYGGLRMALLAANIPFRDVQPQAWQRSLGCLTGGDKNISKSMAQQLFPGMKITHAIADALLIAEWLRRMEVKK